MTLTQLEAFVLVARLGSVKAAAKVLGVSEPAVSGALAALRQHLGDPLVERTPNGMELTPGGKRLVAIASQMVNLAVEAEAAIRDAQGAPELLRVVATSTVAEFVAPGLLAAFTARGGSVEASVGLSATAEMPALLHERLADVGLGPRLAGLRERADDALPAGVRRRPRHRLVAGGRGALPARRWPVTTGWSAPPAPTPRATSAACCSPRRLREPVAGVPERGRRLGGRRRRPRAWRRPSPTWWRARSSGARWCPWPWRARPSTCCGT